MNKYANVMVNMMIKMHFWLPINMVPSTSYDGKCVLWQMLYVKSYKQHNFFEAAVRNLNEPIQFERDIYSN